MGMCFLLNEQKDLSEEQNNKIKQYAFYCFKNNIYNFVFCVSKKLQQKVTPLYLGVSTTISINSQQ